MGLVFLDNRFLPTKNVDDHKKIVFKAVISQKAFLN